MKTESMHVSVIVQDGGELAIKEVCIMAEHIPMYVGGEDVFLTEASRRQAQEYLTADGILPVLVWDDSGVRLGIMFDDARFTEDTAVAWVERKAAEATTQ